MSPNSEIPSKSFSVYAFAIISVFLVVLPESVSNHIKMTVVSPLAPVQKVISHTGNFFKSGFGKITWALKSADENEKLKEKVFHLQNEVINQQNFINMLETGLEIISEYKENIVADEEPLDANVISYDTSNYRRSISIDVGRKHGAAINDIVVYGSVLVGRISAIGRSVSRVVLITDPSSNVPSRFLKSRIQGIVSGTANNKCKVRYVPRHVKVEEGDKVISSGIGGMFPKSIYIGDVVAVKEGSAKLFQDIKLKPRVDFAQIEQVIVIKQNKAEETYD